jgi:transglutaminase-like putative cysteine protease
MGWLRGEPEIPAALRRAYVLVLGPVAALAPVPLFWTEGALPLALVAYEAAVLLLWLKARAGHPVRLSDSILNAVGLSYFLWLALEFVVLKHGLLRSVSHLLLFTAIAKLASLKRPGEARTALLVLFLLTLASASSVTHAASLLYFAAMAVLGIRALGRLAVLADFEDAPPDRVLTAVPTGGVAAALIVVSGLIAVPLFYSLPRIRSPFLTAPVRIDDALSTTLSADKVDLETFGAAKRSDRVVLRMNVSPDRAISRALRLREAVFTDYRGGVWTRNPYARGGRFAPRRFPDTTPAAERPGERLAGRVSVDLNPFANGFLFLPYGATGVQLDRGYPIALSDGMARLPTNRRSVRYSAGLRRVDPRALGATAIDPVAVPPEIRQYAERLTGDLTSPVEIARRIRDHFATEFVYTLDPPTGTGDPIANFLLRTKAGHCEFFASAAALMLTARGIPARLVTGSYGGEIGFLSSAVIVRGTNLHAWVEAELGGQGFVVFDPTPPSGVPAATSRPSFWRGIESVGREVEFFYDRRILGFDAFDQSQFIESARQTIASVSERLPGWRNFFKNRGAQLFAAGLAALALFASAGLWRALRRQRARVPRSTRAYLRLRSLLGRRIGGIAPSVPPEEVARLYSEKVPAGAEDAQAVVKVYCDAAFGGRLPENSVEAELGERIKRLRKLA